MSVDNENETVHIIEYDDVTGAITTSGILTIRQVVSLLASRSNWLIGRGSIDTHYVDPGSRELRVRGPYPAVLTGGTLTAIPVPSTLAWQHDSGSNGSIEVTSDTIELGFDAPGVYTVTLTAVAYAPATYRIEVPG